MELHRFTRPLLVCLPVLPCDRCGDDVVVTPARAICLRCVRSLKRRRNLLAGAGKAWAKGVAR